VRTLDSVLHLAEALVEVVRLTGPGSSAATRLESLCGWLTTESVDPALGVGAEVYGPGGEPILKGRTDVSYGHEAERVSVLDDAWVVLGDRAGVDAGLLGRLLAAQRRHGVDRLQGGYFNRGPLDGPAWDLHKYSWVQVEALLGNLIGYVRTGDPASGHTYTRILEWSLRRQVDHGDGEWHHTVNELGRIRGRQRKTPYHTGRALLRCAALLDELEPAPP
jgi:mannose/cellobiose epimerase-like protein (N-acyl-D-glucosamine 2-epimerase family)